MIPRTVASSSEVKQRSLRAPDQSVTSSPKRIMGNVVFFLLRNNYMNCTNA